MAGTIVVYWRDGAWLEAGPDGFSNETGGYTAGWAEAVSPEERAAAAAALVDVPDVPPGQVETGRHIEEGEGGPEVVLELRDMAAEEVEALAAQRVAEVKVEARRRILAIMTKDQQDNALARGQEMIFTHGPNPADWPAEVQAEYVDIMGRWSEIKDIRAASDLIEASLPTDAEGLATFDAATAEGWPT